MSIFNQFMNDIFDNPDFLEDCWIDNLHYKCIASGISNGITFSEAGLESDQNFTLDLKLPIKKMPAENQKVKFRNKWYKVSNVDTDSAEASIKVYLIALSKGIG